MAAALGFAGVLLAVIVGVSLRLDDPLSTPMIPAEDPYTHMTYTREHLRDGTLDPMNPEGSLYPPGLHAFLAAAWVFTGADLYDIVRIGPVVLGALSIVGIGLLLGRFEGPVAAVTGALALAVAAEPIMRTTMMAPTAVDVALLPFFLFAMLRILLGRVAWMGAAVPLAGFFAYSHPWLFSILALSGGAFLVLAFVFPWPASKAPRLDPLGLALALLVIGAGVALSVSGCWGSCGPGFRDVLPDGERLGILGLPILLLSMVPLLLVKRFPRAFDLVRRVGDERAPVLPRLVLSGWIATGLVAATVPAFVIGMPEFVHLVNMFGWPILVLGFLGFSLLPFLRSPLAHLGAAIALATYPFVIYNPLQSPFWPHRTAVYLGVGLILLAGIAAAGIARAVATLAARLAARDAQRAPRVAVGTVAFAVAVLLGAGVVTATPGPQDHWYRLYSNCDYDALLVASQRAAADPDLVVLSGSWQSKLVLASLTPDASRLWFDVWFYVDERARRNLLGGFDSQGNELLVVADHYVLAEQEGTSTDFLRGPSWTEEARGCAGPNGETPVTIHRYQGGSA